MTVKEARDRIYELMRANQYYTRLVSDPESAVCNSTMLLKLIDRQYSEIKRLEECIYNMELDDSYDRRTRSEMYV